VPGFKKWLCLTAQRARVPALPRASILIAAVRHCNYLDSPGRVALDMAPCPATLRLLPTHFLRLYWYFLRSMAMGPLLQVYSILRLRPLFAHASYTLCFRA
jgi:hypothetical protein